jgi:sugar O-acyltransferase (sialic acid O-acetyltransferase NeuD family)
MRNIIIIGSSGHAKVIIDIIEKENKYQIIGLLDKFKKVGEEVLGYKLIGEEKDIPGLIENYGLVGGLIAVGDNWTRKNIYEKIKLIAPNFQFIKAIHPNAQIARNVQIDNGTVVMGGAVINTNAIIKNHCILNTNSSLDHDCFMDDFSSLAPNATIGGNVTIGRFSAVSLGANVIHGITIKEHTVIGAGSVVLKDIPEFSIAYGIPAKVIRKREAGEKYL